MSRRFASIIVACLIVVPVVGTRVSARQFPVARAEAEFKQLLPFLRGWGEANQGDKELFQQWALPFGPLDLEVRRADSDEADQLRSFYLGVAGGLFGVDSAALAASFHCGPDCIGYRRSQILQDFGNIRAVVSAFRACSGVHLVAQWGLRDDFRVNELYQIGGQARVTTPSPTMGFVPSGNWEAVHDVDAFIRRIGTEPRNVRDIVAAMRASSIAAIVHEGPNIRVVRVGIGDNEAGVVFSNAPPYKVAEKLRDGRQIILVEQLSSGVYYYETT